MDEMVVLCFNSLKNVACSWTSRALSHETGSSGKRRMAHFYDRNKNMSTRKFSGLIKNVMPQRKQDMPEILRPESGLVCEWNLSRGHPMQKKFDKDAGPAYHAHGLHKKPLCLSKDILDRHLDRQVGRTSWTDKLEAGNRRTLPW